MKANLGRIFADSRRLVMTVTRVEAEGLWLNGAKKSVMVAVENYARELGKRDVVAVISLMLVPRAARSTLQVLTNVSEKVKSPEET